MKFGVLASLIVLLSGTVEAAPQKHRVELPGDIFEFLLPISALGWTLLADDTVGTKQFAASFLTTMGLTWTLKLALNKERPNGGPYSMPSGHSASTFAAASFVQSRYGPAFGAPYYIAAGYTGWSRVYTDNHFVEDVVVGAGIAVISSWIWVRRIDSRTKLLPFSGNRLYGIRVQRDF